MIVLYQHHQWNIPALSEARLYLDDKVCSDGSWLTAVLMLLKVIYFLDVFILIIANCLFLVCFLLACARVNTRGRFSARSFFN